jgi:starch phosphorylase
MQPLHTFLVVPSLPPAIGGLRDLAYNLHWTWDHRTLGLFRRLDRDLWEQVGHNPVLMLGKVRQDILAAAANDDGFLAEYAENCERLDEYLAAKRTWYARQAPPGDDLRVAYLSMEFGLNEALPNYSGGLGVLSGDHLKSASDLGLPMVGVTILYQEGYFRQYLNADGYQNEVYPDNDFWNLPLQLVRTPQGAPLTFDLPIGSTRATIQIWRVDVGRVPLYLLDLSHTGNPPELRRISSRLYGGDNEMRIRQELVLGVGGARALEAIGVQPTVFHMNEGHSAFLLVERMATLMERDGLSFDQARLVVSAGSVFTTHTPVPAGFDRFSPELVDRYFGDFYARLRISRATFLGLGRERPADDAEPFSPAILALRLAAHRNGVSRLHGRVSRGMFRTLWPELAEEEVPITSITNGVHPNSWISGGEIGGLYHRYLGPRWEEDPTDAAVWANVPRIPDQELWRAHERRRERLVSFARGRLEAQVKRRGGSAAEQAAALEALDPSALTIGFARRFATYKRANLVFKDIERLARLVADNARPLQIIFAGKAHPDDPHGKEIIREIARHARRPDLAQRVVFLEDYDMAIARYLVQGVDVWLNNPRRPLEASGTSGMKVALNGGLNLSIPDGWWAEAYRPEVGWAIGSGEEYENLELQDEVESRALYEVLERDVIPLFYDRQGDGPPREWVAKMKASIAALAPVFNTHRMVQEYTRRTYWPAADGLGRLRVGPPAAGGAGDPPRTHAGVRALAEWLETLRRGWAAVRVRRVWTGEASEVGVGAHLDVFAEVELGPAAAGDVAVELYHGTVDADGRITGGAVQRMRPDDTATTTPTFRGTIVCGASGLHGYAVRVRADHPDHPDPLSTGLIKWASP